jgi:hypothetical protein
MIPNGFSKVNCSRLLEVELRGDDDVDMCRNVDGLDTCINDDDDDDDVDGKLKTKL